MPSNEDTVRTGHSACSTSSAVSTIDQLTDEDMTKYTVKVGIVVVDIAEINIVDIVDIDVDIVDVSTYHQVYYSGPEDDRPVGWYPRSWEEEYEPYRERPLQRGADRGRYLSIYLYLLV